MRRLLLFLIFFTLAPITLGVSFFTLAKNSLPLASTEHLYAASSQETGLVTGVVATGDARPVIIDQYLEEHNSPMAPYADFLFQMAEKYGLDYRLIIAIAQCETNLCKKAPPDSYNCWGFENGATQFLSWEQAIERVATTLKERYIDQGLTTPEEIMPKYAPPSVEKGGPWARCVNQFLTELE